MLTQLTLSFEHVEDGESVELTIQIVIPSYIDYGLFWLNE